MQYLSDAQVASRYGVSRPLPWKWAKTTDFPKPVKLSTGCTRWKLTDLEEWEATRERAAS